MHGIVISSILYRNAEANIRIFEKVIENKSDL